MRSYGASASPSHTTRVELPKVSHITIDGSEVGSQHPPRESDPCHFPDLNAFDDILEEDPF